MFYFRNEPHHINTLNQIKPLTAVKGGLEIERNEVFIANGMKVAEVKKNNPERARERGRLDLLFWRNEHNSFE